MHQAAAMPCPPATLEALTRTRTGQIHTQADMRLTAALVDTQLRAATLDLQVTADMLLPVIMADTPRLAVTDSTTTPQEVIRADHTNTLTILIPMSRVRLLAV